MAAVGLGDQRSGCRVKDCEIQQRGRDLGLGDDDLAALCLRAYRARKRGAIEGGPTTDNAPGKAGHNGHLLVDLRRLRQRCLAPEIVHLIVQFKGR